MNRRLGVSVSVLVWGFWGDSKGMRLEITKLTKGDREGDKGLKEREELRAAILSGTQYFNIKLHFQIYFF